jgi:hypothetical protein
MQAFGIIGMTFGFFGVIAFLRLQKLEKHLKDLGVLGNDYKGF